jgi:hypothetical protein
MPRQALATDPADREAAWWRLHDTLPPAWRLGEMTFDPAGEVFVIAAMSPRPRGRVATSEHVIVGRGHDELAAVRALVAALEAGRVG